MGGWGEVVDVVGVVKVVLVVDGGGWEGFVPEVVVVG